MSEDENRREIQDNFSDNSSGINLQESICSLSCYLGTETSGSYSTLADFILNDINAKKQRSLLMRLHSLELPIDINSPLLSDTIKVKEMVHPLRQGRYSRISAAFTKLKPVKYSLSVSLHLLYIYVVDLNEKMAIRVLESVSAKFLKKNFLHVNKIFLLALANRLEQFVYLMLTKGFPRSYDSPIIMASSKSKRSTFLSSSSSSKYPPIFPSYFIVSVALGLELVVRHMIKNGANVNQSWNGLTSLHIATYSQHRQSSRNLVKLLLVAGANPWAVIDYSKYALLLQFRKHSLGSSTKSSLLTTPWPSVPLKLLRRTYSEKTKFSMDDLNSREFGLPSLSLHAVSQKPFSYRNEPFSKDRKQNNSDNSKDGFKRKVLFDNWKVGKGFSPLNFACCTSYVPHIIELLKKMLTKAPRKTYSFPNSLNLLKSKKLVSIPKGSEFVDQLSLLVQQDPVIMVYLLRSNFVNIEQTDALGANALHLAVRLLNVEAIEVLLYFDGSDKTLLNSQGENGWTALHEALSVKNLEITRLLLKRGADLTLKGNNGETVWEIGQRAGIDPSDLESVWLVSPKMATLPHYKTTFTPERAIDFMVNYKILDILNLNIWGYERKNGMQSFEKSETFPGVRKGKFRLLPKLFRKNDKRKSISQSIPELSMHLGEKDSEIVFRVSPASSDDEVIQ